MSIASLTGAEVEAARQAAFTLLDNIPPDGLFTDEFSNEWIAYYLLSCQIHEHFIGAYLSLELKEFLPALTSLRAQRGVGRVQIEQFAAATAAELTLDRYGDLWMQVATWKYRAWGGPWRSMMTELGDMASTLRLIRKEGEGNALQQLWCMCALSHEFGGDFVAFFRSALFQEAVQAAASDACGVTMELIQSDHDEAYAALHGVLPPSIAERLSATDLSVLMQEPFKRHWPALVEAVTPELRRSLAEAVSFPRDALKSELELEFAAAAAMREPECAAADAKEQQVRDNLERDPAQCKAQSRRDPKLEARDKWIYQQCCKGRAAPYLSIIAELKKKAQAKGWEPIDSPQGIRRAASKYAIAHDLPQPSRRQDL
jgi:hypothetical protein